MQAPGWIGEPIAGSGGECGGGGGSSSAAARAGAPAAEAVRQAAAEGLALERSDSATGFKGVIPSGRRFVARHNGASREGSVRHLGTFETREEAALAYARAQAAKGAAVGAVAGAAGGGSVEELKAPLCS
jgi:hypothetical protein